MYSILGSVSYAYALQIAIWMSNWAGWMSYCCIPPPPPPPVRGHFSLNRVLSFLISMNTKIRCLFFSDLNEH